MKNRRSDIQALRGYAILVVLLYHAGLAWAPSGYIGVDVFFVISGFLITDIIDRQIQRGDFSIARFYLRRIQRLLPAAYVTFLVSAILAPSLLTSIELKDFSSQLVGAVTLTANYVLKNQTGYFEGAADLKPLLHTWSLSVEEQFYLLIPIVLLATPRRWHGALFVTLALGSLSANLLARANPETIFYTLPYRAWELAVGATAARLITHRRSRWLQTMRLHWMGWVALAVIPFLTINAAYAQWALVIACGGTAIILMTYVGHLSFDRSMRWLTWTGDISYSLYLVHWPILAYYNNMLLVPNKWDGVIRIGLLILSFALATALHYGVEKPILKTGCVNRRMLMTSGLAGGTLFVAVSMFVMKPLSNQSEFLELRRENLGLGRVCTETGPYVSDQCRTSDAPNMLVWGDSMAMHLINGLNDPLARGEGIQQATRHMCAPFLDLTYKPAKRENFYIWENSCQRFNDEVLSHLRDSTSIQVVVLAARWDYYFKVDAGLVVFDADGAREIVHEGVPPAVVHALSETIKNIRGLGKRVILIDAPPFAIADVSRCAERAERKLPSIGMTPDCGISREGHLASRSRMNEVLIPVLASLDVSMIRFDDYLCDANWCNTTRNGLSLYRDQIHFSKRGADEIIRGMNLLGQIRTMAR